MHVTRFNPGNMPGRIRTPEDRQLARDAGADLALGSIDPDFESFGLPPSKNFNVGDSLVINLDSPIADFRRRLW